MRKTLWSRNFTIITLGTIISAIGSAAMSLALSLVVFDQTGSTLMTSIYGVVSLIPSIIIPILLAPYVDIWSRKKIIVLINSINGVLYLAFGLFVFLEGFHYAGYLLFSFMINTTGVIYHLAYQALYPELIPAGFIQKGYSVSSMIYPMAIMIIAPLTAFVYASYGIVYIMVIEGCLLLIAALLEHFIKIEETHIKAKKIFNLKDHWLSIKEGYSYIVEYKGLGRMYMNLSIVSGVSNANNMMEMAYFQTTPLLSTTMYSFLLSAETLGRTLGSVFHYLFKIPKEKKYLLMRNVWLLYESMDSILLFMPYPIMIVIKFAEGFMGINTATLRNAAIQKHLPKDKRARVNSILGVMMSVGLIVFRLLAGIMGELFSYRLIAFSCSFIGIIAIIVMIGRGRKDIEPIINVDL